LGFIQLNKEETLNVLTGIIDDYIEFHKVEVDPNLFDYIIKICDKKIITRKFPDKAIDLLDEAMCIAKNKGYNYLKESHIDEAFKNITGALTGVLDYDYKFDELEPYYLDNFLGIKENKNLVSILFSGNDANLKLLTEEVKKGFGITSEMILELNMSNYSDATSLSSLIGSSPGYIGYDDGGIISEHFAQYPYQLLIIHNYELASFDVKEFILLMKDKGFFFDKKGREYKTINTVFIFVNNDVAENNIGFIKQDLKRKDAMSYNIKLSNKVDYVDTNPYLLTLKQKGFELAFEPEEFLKYKNNFKKSFLSLLNKYEKGKYALKFNEETKEIDIFIT
jgi:hypothetical protein